MAHTVDHAGATQEHRALLIMDNHRSNISLGVIATARKNGVDIVSITPHCSHVVQPLDVTVYGPLKKSLARQVKYFHDSHPGQHITDMEIGKLFTNAYNTVFRNQELIMSGFEATGIYPYNPGRVLEDPRHFRHHAVLEDRPDDGDTDDENEAGGAACLGSPGTGAGEPAPGTSTGGPTASTSAGRQEPGTSERPKPDTSIGKPALDAGTEEPAPGVRAGADKKPVTAPRDRPLTPAPGSQHSVLALRSRQSTQAPEDKHPAPVPE